jgi:probable F420-dependent oxidoreductase
MSHRPFRFAVNPSLAPDGASWIETARRAEDLGYSTLFVMDHFGDQLSAVPAMTAAAAATSTLRVGSLVFANDYRHPVVLAKDIATVDLLSDGRVEFGIGAGWMTSDYRESGISLDPARVRVDRLEEAIAVYKGLWADGPLSHQGDHYEITALDGRPKPIQRPHPPILIGGGGDRVLAIAAREADLVGINPNMKAGRLSSEAARDATAPSVDRKLARVRDVAADRFGAIELNILSFAVAVTDDRAATTELFAGFLDLTPEQIDASPYVLIGSAPEIAEDLRRYRDRWGISYITVLGDVMEPFAPVVAELAGT